MSNGSITVSLDLNGLDLTIADLAAWPAEARAAAAEANQEAINLLARAIEDETPVRTGRLLRSERFTAEGPFEVWFSSRVPYATFVLAHNQFIERGKESVRAQAEGAYTSSFDRLADVFSHGGFR